MIEATRQSGAPHSSAIRISARAMGVFSLSSMNRSLGITEPPQHNSRRSLRLPLLYRLFFLVQRWLHALKPFVGILFHVALPHASLHHPAGHLLVPLHSLLTAIRRICA